MVRPPDAAEAEAIAIWDDLLRAYAEVIECQRVFLLALGSLDTLDDVVWDEPVFEIPADVPPMPASFEPWATSLLSETAGLAELAHGILSERPAVVRPPRFAAASSGSTLDQKI